MFNSYRNNLIATRVRSLRLKIIWKLRRLLLKDLEVVPHADEAVVAVTAVVEEDVMIVKDVTDVFMTITTVIIVVVAVVDVVSTLMIKELSQVLVLPKNSKQYQDERKSFKEQYLIITQKIEWDNIFLFLFIIYILCF